MEHARRVALVTGGAKRVGRAIVIRLAQLGFDVAFTYLSSAAEADEVRAEVEGLGGAALPIRADLTDPAAAVDGVDRALASRFARLDVLVNNASTWAPARLAETTPELMRKLWAVHAESPLLLCQRFAARLRSAKGHVVNMVDLLAERPWPQYLPYCASKAALLNLTLGLARELAPEVTVNGIAPGVVEWPDGYPEAEREKYLKRVPLARPGTPEDVAGLVEYLVTKGSYVTGQILRLDGGRSIT
ncbi:MAG TPA: SDR family oxidoreductase [Humisphaera sp.]